MAQPVAGAETLVAEPKRVRIALLGRSGSLTPADAGRRDCPYFVGADVSDGSGSFCP